VRPRRTLAVGLLLTCLGTARAEEGLFVARMGGGIRQGDDAPRLGGALLASADLCLSERTGLLGEVTLGFGGGTRLGLGLGPKHLLYEGEERRVYGYLAPELMLVWPEQRERRVDLAAHAGLGVEYLFMWGLGVVVEIGAVVPAGFGQASAGEGAWVAMVAGLYMEF